MKTTNVFGIHSILEAIKSGTPIEKVWLLRGGKSKLYDRLIYTLKSKTIPFSFVPEEKLEKLSKKIISEQLLEFLQLKHLKWRH